MPHKLANVLVLVLLGTLRFNYILYTSKQLQYNEKVEVKDVLVLVYLKCISFAWKSGELMSPRTIIEKNTIHVKQIHEVCVLFFT